MQSFKMIAEIVYIHKLLTILASLAKLANVTFTVKAFHCLIVTHVSLPEEEETEG